MLPVYVSITLLAAAFNGAAAIANLIGHEYPKREADRNRIPRSLVRPFGVLLGAGALGLLIGFAVPALGALAAAGLVGYFLVALGAHVRAGNYRLSAWALYFALAVAALAVNLAYH